MHQTQTARRLDQRRTMRLAWVVLLGFFMLFVALLGSAGLALRDLYRTATEANGALLFVRGPAEAISWKPADRTTFTVLQGSADTQALGEGDAVRVATAAGYGQVASVRLFDDSQLDLWAAAEVSIARLRTSRWHSDTLQVMLEQHTGYVRYDIKPVLAYGSTSYRVQIGDASLELAPGGSYSVDMRAMRTIARPDGGNELASDVAVRTGAAVVLGANGVRTTLRAGERVLVDAAGNPGLAVPARWELIADGGFSQYSEQEYNNTTSTDPTLPRSDAWQVYGTPPNLPPEDRGFFRLSQICRPPVVNNSCAQDERRTAAWFYRTGNKTLGFAVGVEQLFGPDDQGIDISEYRSLRLSLWARVIYQSLRDAGDGSSECPVMVRLLAKRFSPADPEVERVICMYADIDGQAPQIEAPGVHYIPVPLAEWRQISFDLRDEEWLPDYRYLRSIQIYANGHDYDSRVAEVSLIGEQ
jgi:hypothetical protein